VYKPGGDNNMNISWPRLVAVVVFSVSVYFALGDASAASRESYSTEVELDRLIPQEKWAAAGLDKLTSAEQRALADDITALVASGRSIDNAISSTKDRSEWRKLQRHTSKDEVKRLLGEPMRVSVSSYYESWYYLGGAVTFDGKGRLDSWNEN